MTNDFQEECRRHLNNEAHEGTTPFWAQVAPADEPEYLICSDPSCGFRIIRWSTEDWVLE